jgi:hypothetical protein
MAECPHCGKGVAVRPLSGLLYRHGKEAACPGSDEKP